MNRLWLVAAREYVENVRTKAFIFAVLLTPILMGLSVLIPMFAGGAKPEKRTIALADVTGRLGPAVAKGLMEPPEKGGAQSAYYVETVDLGPGDAEAREARARALRHDLDRRVKEGGLFAWVLLRPSALAREGPPSEYRTGNLVEGAVMEDVRTVLRKVADTQIVQDRGIPKDAAKILTTKMDFEASSVLAETKAGSAAATIMPFFFSLLLFFSILSVSQALITSTIEEKGTRVIEILLSSVSPLELMGGKILGTCLVGLTLMTIWTLGAIGALAANGLLALVDASQLGLCLVYYLLGFGLIASLMVAVGSTCNTLKEAQNLLSPLMVVLTLPILFWITVARDPHGSVAVFLSFVPLFTPFIMMMRISGATPPPPLETAASVVVLALATWLAVRLAARVFRVGVLLYGKPPSLREIVRWMRVKN